MCSASDIIILSENCWSSSDVVWFSPGHKYFASCHPSSVRSLPEMLTAHCLTRSGWQAWMLPKIASPCWPSMLNMQDESCWSWIVGSSSTNPYNVLCPAAIILLRTCSTPAFASAHALTPVAAWSFCTHSCCKFLMSASVTGWALSHGHLIAHVDWSTNENKVFSSHRGCFELAMSARGNMQCKHVASCEYQWNIDMSTCAREPCELCTAKGNVRLQKPLYSVCNKCYQSI